MFSRRMTEFGETVRPYSSIEKVVQTSCENSDGKTVEVTRIHIIFKDGARWKDGDYFALHQSNQPWVAFVCTASGKPLTQAQFIEDVVGR